VQDVRDIKAPGSRVGLTLTGSLHDPVLKTKPHGIGEGLGSPGKLYSDKPGRQGHEIFGWGWSCVDPSHFAGNSLSSWRGARLVRILSTRRVLLDLAGELYRAGQDRKSSELFGL
jgi:hypothetical protein